jgi:hypothetical protein
MDIKTIKKRQEKRKERSESAEACELVRLFTERYRPWADLLIHIPNGVSGGAAKGRIKQREGVRAGVPDYFLAAPTKTSGGLWIELKKKSGGKLSKQQEKYIELLRSQGYIVEVCNGAEAAMVVIDEYLMSYFKNLFFDLESE